MCVSVIQRENVLLNNCRTLKQCMDCCYFYYLSNFEGCPQLFYCSDHLSTSSLTFPIQITLHSTVYFLGSSATHPLGVKSAGWTDVKKNKWKIHTYRVSFVVNLSWDVWKHVDNRREPSHKYLGHLKDTHFSIVRSVYTLVSQYRS